jgi:serine/threonine protein kinase
MTEQPNREVAVLNAALELPQAERKAYLDQACADDATLRQQVEALLNAHEHAEDFLEAPPAGLDFTRTQAANITLTEKLGDKIGRYKLLQQIGEGGCGMVYMAEQEEPVRRRVALKVIKLGMDTKSVIARFEAERQALALMDHPNIARVLDAGATEKGRPYFVMELVRGIKITEFCDENKFSTSDRLKLFIQVCQAIQHAHQKGIIHRDIKPSNILVTVNDGVPVPKVIDFGIAKATQGRLTDKTLFTAFDQFIGTPAYMSPEQAEMTSLDIDTRSDIYSLGVLLYELLTGKTPFDAKELLQVGLDAMRRTIRDSEPLKPSTKLSTMLDAERSIIARQRQTDSPKLLSLVRGDLDWVVMKSLEKDRTRRYETANGFAADIQRHLANEPVSARPPRGLYRLQKSLRRNKGAFAAVAIIVCVLLIGIVVSVTEAIRATRAEREQVRLRQRAEADEKNAQTEALKSEQTAKFLTDMLKAAGPGVARGRDATLLREILNKTEERVGKELANQPEVQGDLWLTLGSTYDQIGDQQRAILNLQRAVDSYRISSNQSNSKLARTLGFLGACQSYIGNISMGKTNTQLSLAMARKGGDALTLATCLDYAAYSFLPWAMCATQGVPYFREELALRKQLGKTAGVTLCMRSLACALDGTDEAESLLRDALAMDRQNLSSDDPQISQAMFGLGQTLLKRDKVDEAETFLLQAAVMDRKILDRNHPSLGIEMRILAQTVIGQSRTNRVETLLQKAAGMSANEPRFEADLLNAFAAAFKEQNELDEAEALGRKALAIRRKLFGDQHLDVSQSLNFLALVLLQRSWELPPALKQSKLTEAELLAREGLAIRRNQLAEPSIAIVESLVCVAEIRRAQNDFSEAESLGRQALEIRKKLLGYPDGISAALTSLGDTLNDERKFSEAEDLFRQALARYQETWGGAHFEIANAFAHLAGCLQKQGRFAEAEPLFRQSLTIATDTLEEKDPYIAYAVTTLAEVLRDEGKLAESEQQFREALRIRRKYLGDQSPGTAASLNDLTDLLKREGKPDEARTLINGQSAPAAEEKHDSH